MEFYSANREAKRNDRTDAARSTRSGRIERGSMTTDSKPTGMPRIGLETIAAAGNRDLLFPPPQEIFPDTLSHLRHPFALVAGNRPLRLDLHLPRQATGPVPVVVYASGGGFRFSMTHTGPWMCLVGTGYAVAVVEYRLSSEAKHPGPLHDVKGAIRWLRANAGAYGLDPERIAGWGSSAGGYLISLAAVTADSPEFDGTVGDNLDQSSALAAVIEHYAPTDFLTLAGDTDNAVEPFGTADSFETQYLGYIPSNRPDEAAAAAVASHVTSSTVPFLILHGDADTRVGIEQSRRLHRALEAAGAEADLHVIPGVNHVAPEFEQDEANKLALAFLARHLGS